MPTHVVIHGETLPAIAQRYGLSPDTIWSHPENAALRRLRGAPSALYEADRLYVPDLRPRVESVATGGAHTFRRNGVPAYFRLQLVVRGRPRAGERCRLAYRGREVDVVSDDNGVVGIWLPPSVATAKLTLGDGSVLELDFAGLPPIDLVEGVQERLTNLGFRCGAEGQWDDATRTAVQQFQSFVGLPATGQFDGETRKALVALHDKPETAPGAR